MTRFRKRRKTVVVSFAEHEADILANLLRNLVELLYDGMPPRGMPAGMQLFDGSSSFELWSR